MRVLGIRLHGPDWRRCAGAPAGRRRTGLWALAAWAAATGADMAAARAAGARAILVPNDATRSEKEVAAASVVATDPVEAVDLVLSGDRPTPAAGRVERDGETVGW